MAKVDTDQVVLAVSALYVVLFFPLNQTILTALLAVAVYSIKPTPSSAAGAFLFMIVLRWLTSLLKPAAAPRRNASPIEGFQAKDPISIHQRIAAEARKIPRTTAASPEITGVLESPEILDNMQISVIPPSEVGAARATKPAPLHADTRIRTPAEGFVPAVPSPDAAPKPTPYLQNGPDREAEGTALVPSGAALAAGVPAGSLPSTTVGPSPV